MAIQPTRLDDILGLHIRLAHGAVLRHFSEHFSELDLSQKQVSVLWLVHDHPSIAQIDLGRRMQMDRATTMAIVHALERKQLLSRQEDKQDRRRIAFSLTADGNRILDAARVAIAEHELWLKSRFSAAELRQLMALLRRIHDAPQD